MSSDELGAKMAWVSGFGGKCTSDSLDMCSKAIGTSCLLKIHTNLRLLADSQFDAPTVCI